MRGRTNAGGSGTLAIKGNVEQFKVAEGTSVAVGDFVEYKTVKSENVLSYNRVQQEKTEQVGVDLIVTKSKGSLLLLRVAEDKLNIIASYNEKKVNGFCTMSDGRIAVSVNDEPYLVILKIENDLFIISTEATDSMPAPASSVEEFNNKLYLIQARKESSVYYATFYVFLENEDSTISLEKTDDTNIEFIRTSEYKVVLNTFILGSNICYIIYGEDSSGNIRSENSGAITIKEDGFGKYNLGFDGDAKSFFPITFFDKYAFWGKTNAFYLKNISSGEKTGINADSFGFVWKESNLNYCKSAYAKYGEDKFAIFFFGGEREVKYYQVATFQLNKNSGTITRLSDIFIPEFTELTQSIGHNVFGMFFFENNVIPTQYANNATYDYMIAYDNNSNQLSDQIDKNYVETYKGGNTMGVAKQSGTGGQKIDVFVPKL